MARCRSGTAAIEFAIVAPVFLTMLYGLIETGRVFWTQSTLQYAVEEAVRFAIVDNSVSESDVASIAVSNAIGLAADASDFTVTFETVGAVRNFITVQAAYQFEFLTPFLPIPPFDITTSYRSAVVQ